MILEKIKKLPIGYSEVNYKGKKFGVTRLDFNNGNSIKVYAEELGATEFISFNFYIMKSGDLLKPCEMPEQKVLDFLENFHFS